MMNMVGTEVDVINGVVLHRSHGTTHSASDEDDDDEVDDEDECRDLHPPISPKTGAERLFLGLNLETQQISAYALAQQIHQQHRIDCSSGTTIGTEDYQTAAPFFSDDNDSLMFPSFNSPLVPRLVSTPNSSSAASPFFGKDALSHSRDIHHSRSYSSNGEDQFHDANMSTTSTSDNSSTCTKTDPAEKVYDTAKSVWGWGKSVTVFRPFLGLAEGVAGKVVGIAFGSNLEEVDDTIQKQLSDIDVKYLNPAIAAIVTMLLGTVSKSEEILKPLLQTLLMPVKLIKKDEAAKETPPPEVTSPATPSTPAMLAAK